jgi:riboflavin kinase / FMN adenylyltransferase
VSIGVYDGVHRGHRTLVRRVVREATRRRAPSLIITFDPHPRCVVSPDGCPPLLTDPAERAILLRELGIERVFMLHFTSVIAHMSAESFCAALVQACAPQLVVEGEGFAFGHERRGTMRMLRRYGAEHGFDVAAVAPVQCAGTAVSATRVRNALSEGRIGEANGMLGRHYALAGTVVPGRRVGARLGFPTANIAADRDRCVPGAGVYATWIDTGQGWMPSATSIGVRPTFDDAGGVTIEAHVLDFDDDLYGRRARLAFVRRLRAERRFASERALSTAIAHDVQRVRSLLHAGAPA